MAAQPQVFERLCNVDFRNIFIKDIGYRTSLGWKSGVKLTQIQPVCGVRRIPLPLLIYSTKGR